MNCKGRTVHYHENYVPKSTLNPLFVTRFFFLPIVPPLEWAPLISRMLMRANGTKFAQPEITFFPQPANKAREFRRMTFSNESYIWRPRTGNSALGTQILRVLHVLKNEFCIFWRTLVWNLNSGEKLRFNFWETLDYPIVWSRVCQSCK